MPVPSYGDIIFASRLGYNHYGVYVGNNKVVHYCKDVNGCCDGVIRETSLNSFLNNDALHICNFNESNVNLLFGAGLLLGGMALLAPPLAPVGILLGKVAIGSKIVSKAKDILSNESEENRTAAKVFTPQETVSRARSQIGKGEYNLVVHNCEHFAIWCKTGVASSEQVNKIIRVVSPI